MADVLAAVISSFNQPAELQRIPLPEPEPSGVFAKVDAATLCGTDAHNWTGEGIPASELPYIPGHETAGMVEEVRGERFDIMGEPIRPGDRIISTYPHCGRCYFCTVAQQPNLCINAYSFGRQAPARLLGGCAEMHYYPAASDLIKVPEEVSSPLAASAACALRTVIHAYERLGAINSADTVLVQGAGPLGLYATAIAKDRGARKVLVIGAPENRLNVARDWGADDVCNLDEVKDAAKRKEWVMEHTAGLGADVVVQVAVSSAIPEGLDLARRGGRLAAVGTSPGDISLPGRLITMKTLTVVGVFGTASRHFNQALQFLATRKKLFPFEKLLSNTYTLDRVGEALQAMADFKEVKPIVLPKAG